MIDEMIELRRVMVVAFLGLVASAWVMTNYSEKVGTIYIALAIVIVAGVFAFREYKEG